MDDVKILRLVSMITRKYKMRLSKSLERFNLTAGEYPIYMVICREPGLAQDEISAKAYVDKGFTTRVLKSFIEKDFIYKEHDKNDKRINHIYPTQKAVDMYSDVRKELRNESDKATSCFTDEEIDILRDMLFKLDENITL